MEDELNALSEAISYLNLAKGELEGLPRFREYIDMINSDIEEIGKELESLETRLAEEYEENIAYLNREYERSV